MHRFYKVTSSFLLYSSRPYAMPIDTREVSQLTDGFASVCLGTVTFTLAFTCDNGIGNAQTAKKQNSCCSMM